MKLAALSKMCVSGMLLSRFIHCTIQRLYGCFYIFIKSAANSLYLGGNYLIRPCRILRSKMDKHPFGDAGRFSEGTVCFTQGFFTSSNTSVSRIYTILLWNVHPSTDTELAYLCTSSFCTLGEHRKWYLARKWIIWRKANFLRYQSLTLQLFL